MLEGGQERLLIIAPHADDEVLGCGGLIEKACRYHNAVKVVVGAVGNIDFLHCKDIVTAQTRKKELSEALDILGCQNFEIMFDDKESLLDTVPQNEMIKMMDKMLSEFQPTMVFIPYPSFHQDHRALFQACMAGLRPRPGLNCRLVAMYEYPNMIWQYPKVTEAGEIYMDISATINKKIEALRKHCSQLRDPKHPISPESVKRWACTRGMEIGVDYAEKYYLLKAHLL